MNFKKSVNDYSNSGKDLSDFILSQPCGYISHFRTNNHSPISSTYSPKVTDEMEAKGYGSKKN